MVQTKKNKNSKKKTKASTNTRKLRKNKKLKQNSKSSVSLRSSKIAKARSKASKKKSPNMNARSKSAEGSLIIVGGAEGKIGEMVILKEIASRVGKGHLVLVTAASAIAMELWEDYKKLFNDLGVRDIVHLYVENMEHARRPENIDLLESATVIFFTGGDQLKITTKLGGTEIGDKIRSLHKEGASIAGTSAGASVLGDIMLVGHGSEDTHKVGNWMMAPGLGLAPGMIIDQHFAQRGRIGRLLGAVAMNPGILGIGIDEDTAIVLDKEEFKVIGSNAVYIVDGRDVTYTNISEAAAEATMSMHNAKIHILAAGERFNLQKRFPSLSSN